VSPTAGAHSLSPAEQWQGINRLQSHKWQTMAKHSTQCNYLNPWTVVYDIQGVCKASLAYHQQETAAAAAVVVETAEATAGCCAVRCHAYVLA
jgi:hypothetical protein